MIKIMSFGAGVQTQAMLFTIGKKMDYIVFADTGNEHQETYDYINNYSIPFCKINNIPFVRVYNKYGKTLYEYCWDKKIVPSIRFRDCTSKFKIAPIRKFVRKELLVDRKHPCKMYIGISYDEATRMNPSNVKYAINQYPLIDGFDDLLPPKTTRDDCKKIIQKQGFPLPPKSGCTFCPYASPVDLLDERYRDKTIALEENNSRFPELLLRGMQNRTKPIRELLVSDERHETCGSGVCFN